MATPETPPLLPVPQVNIHFVPAQVGDRYPIGPMTIRVIEDGSHTDNRLGAVEVTIPPHTQGPQPHWHEMHDETFLITKGTVRFKNPGNDNYQEYDAKLGDYVTVPIRSPHTFENTTDEEARFYNTFTPAFYVHYFKLLSELADGGPITAQVGKAAMSAYASFPVPNASASVTQVER